MITKALAYEIRDAVVTATHPCSLLDPLRKARDFISAVAEAMPHEVRKIQERYIAYMQTLVSLEPHRNPLAAQLADDVATLLNITLQQAATIEQQQNDRLHIEGALPEFPVGLVEHVAVWRAALKQPLTDRRGLPSEKVVSWFESLLAIIQRQTETIERQRAWSGALQQADREIHELKESRDAALAKVDQLQACQSYRANQPSEVVACSDCIACLRLNLKWTDERKQQLLQKKTAAGK